MAYAVLLAFVAVPIIEIAIFIQVGGLIGLFPTLLIVLATAVAGTALLRAQGFRALQSARATLDRGGFPARELFDGACILIGGVLLLTPGFSPMPSACSCCCRRSARCSEPMRCGTSRCGRGRAWGADSATTAAAGPNRGRSAERPAAVPGPRRRRIARRPYRTDHRRRLRRGRPAGAAAPAR